MTANAYAVIFLLIIVCGGLIIWVAFRSLAAWLATKAQLQIGELMLNIGVRGILVLVGVLLIGLGCWLTGMLAMAE